MIASGGRCQHLFLASSCLQHQDPFALRQSCRSTSYLQSLKGRSPFLRLPGRRRLSAVSRQHSRAKNCTVALQAKALQVHDEKVWNAKVSEERPLCQAAKLEDILKEKGECGVGFIANLKNQASHTIIEQACQALGCMEHRGACSADNDSGDGSGIMMQIPWDVIEKDVGPLNRDSTGVGMIFLPNDDKLAAEARDIVEHVVKKEGRCKVKAWRDVPVDTSVVGRLAKATEPRIVQVMIEHLDGITGDELEREMFILRKLMESEKADRMSAITAEKDPKAQADAADFYICTLSNKVIVYKGMLRSVVVKQFYLDLQNEAFVSSFAIYHRRYSTNTNPKWPLAQPMRVLGHNGEINTFQGNLNWVASREHSISNPVWHGRESEFLPLCSSGESDSANLDHVAELLVRTGTPPQEALMILVPEAYDNHPHLQANYPEVIPFYEYFEGLQEGWDGPALLVFSDGNKVGARLDRNGLRPARYWLTNDDMVYVASEVGVLGDVLSNAENITSKGRLGPGQMVCADLSRGIFQNTIDLAKEVAEARPYKEWLTNSHRLEELEASSYLEETQMDLGTVLKLQTGNGMGLEDSQMIIEGMAQQGAEPTYCMGDDTPLPVLSSRPHIMYDYFKQRFAQVTNPPIDPLREGLVMSLNMRLGKRGNLLQPSAEAYSQIILPSPFLLEKELEAIKSKTSLKNETFSLHYQSGQQGALAEALTKLCSDVEDAVNKGVEVLILSDRIEGDLEADCPPIPTLLAVGAVHHHLIRKGLRTETSIVAETAQCSSTHQMAVLIGYGAHAICPYLALETCRQWRLSNRTQSLVKSGKMADLTVADAQKNFKKAVEKGILKILSKMGISLLSCYHGAQIFEAYGLGEEVVDLAFNGSVSRIGGLSLNDLQREAESFWSKAFPDKDLKKLEDYGFIQSRPKGEYHANNQQMSKLLHKAVGLGGKGSAPQSAYQSYQEHFEQSPVSVLRDCLELVPAGPSIPIDEVQSTAEIMERFCTGGMSLGAISRETHETIAVAMNRIGGKSNSGEGGEDPSRWKNLDDVDAEGNSPTFPHLSGLQKGDIVTSRIKQVASGRFGVTPQFMVNAEQLEIKIAQGAKPGEGGQLPGKKVSPYIANLRRSKPGVPLISPPPHHDIYSIEDLAQLIFDLHQVAPQTKVSVKLVAQAGIGTVASGVAKANADIIQISGHDGGTGASPVSSIKHAGGPIEMGLAETQQSLVQNELRDRVLLRVDGGLRNGRDVLLLSAMGGDEFGFGTVAMIATGCIMARVCHTNNCPVGVASQREELRARFPGAPGDLVNFFQFVANEIRAELAHLGLRSLDELTGRTDLLKQRDLSLGKTSGLDLSFLTRYVGGNKLYKDRIGMEVLVGIWNALRSSSRYSHLRRAFQSLLPSFVPEVKSSQLQAHSNGPVLDDNILEDKEVTNAIETEGTVHKSYEIFNTDRASLGRVGGRIARLHGDTGFAGTVSIDLQGSAGQSFACFVVNGMKIKLTGEANDYVGKGMAGGEVTIVPPPNSQFRPEDASLVGNTCLYGATGGRLFVNGRAGERFAVRNSMAEAVVEGAGDHCCEYMTGGCVVSLGRVGRNVAAGMTGGLGYFFDEAGDFPDKVNTEIVQIQRIETRAGEKQLQDLIQAHVDSTSSSKGQTILSDWSNQLQKFWQLVPPSEAQSPEASSPEEGVGKEKKDEQMTARAA